jgi:hypothetical protein
LALLTNPRGELEISAPLAAELPAAPRTGLSGRDTQGAAGGAAPNADPTPAQRGFRAPFDSVAEALGAALRARLAEVTGAPFEALASLSGRDAAGLRAVEFEPGTAQPSAAGTETLKALAAALSERPGLALYAAGGFDPNADHRALAAQEIDLHVALATAGATLNVEPGPVDFSSPRDQDVLDEFAGQRLSAEQRATIASETDVTEDGKPAAKHSTAYYEAIFDALVANTKIDQSALARLGRYRARSIADSLAKLGIAAARVETGGGDGVLRSDPDGVAVPLELEVLGERHGQAAGSAESSTGASGSF